MEKKKIRMSTYGAHAVARRHGQNTGEEIRKENMPVYRYRDDQLEQSRILNGMNYHNKLRDLVLPSDVRDHKTAQARRQARYRSNAATERFSHFMRTPNQAQRLNNPSQEAAMKQRQRVGPDSQRQFYAFMRAMSARFGSYRG